MSTPAMCPNHGLIPLTAPEGLYINFFVYGTYLLTLFVLYRMLTAKKQKTGEPGEGFHLVNHDILLLVALLFVFWGLESLGHVAEPFLTYPDIGIMLPLPDSLPGWLHHGIAPYGEIADCIACAKNNPAYGNGIPLAVVLMESLLAFAALKTTQALGFGVLQRPFVSAIALVVFDLFADPVLAITYACEISEVRGGVGLWNWYVLFNNPNFANWYGIPLYNYAAWFAGPLLAIAFAYWFNIKAYWLYEHLIRKRPTHISRDFSGYVLLAILIFCSIWVKMFNPLVGISVGFQYHIFFGFFAISILGVIASTNRLRIRQKTSLSVIAIFSFFIGYVIVTLITGPFKHPLSIWVTITCCGALILFVASPYLGRFWDFFFRKVSRL